jgi:hypothetical protein
MHRIILSCLLLACCVAAQTPAFSPEIKRVAVFKNGYAFTYREGETKTANGFAYTERIPIGVLGTIWGYANAPNARVTQLMASESDEKTEARARNPVEFLLANEGARIRIEKTYVRDKVFEGVYEILRPKEDELRLATSSEGELLTKLTVALKTAEGVLLIPAAQIQSFEIIGGAKWTLAALKKERRLTLRAEGVTDGETINLGIAALERGIRWVPNYRLSLLNATEARLELEGLLINELTDLKNSEVNFVVGVPHFFFQDTVSPLSLNQAFAGVSQYFAGENRNALTNSISSRAKMGEDLTARGRPLTDPEAEALEEAKAAAADQLYLYKVDGVTMKKGGSASVRLFSTNIPCREVFDWQVRDGNTNANDASIWYTIRLKNQTGRPWTTAPLLVMRDWQPVGQDLLRFTPNGNENTLRVTPATEVIGTHTLAEKSRQNVTLRIDGEPQTYRLVTVEGSLKVRNTRPEPVEVAITRNLSGTVLAASDGGAFNRNAANLEGINTNSVITWNLTVAPGERIVTYSYKTYVKV